MPKAYKLPKTATLHARLYDTQPVRVMVCPCRHSTWCEQLSHDRTGLVYRALGFPPQFFTVMFAVPRIVGYLSHWKESLADPDTKIMRPQEDYRVSARRAGPAGLHALGSQSIGP